MDFQTKLKALMAEYNLGIQETKGLTGDELEEAINNNEGMEQLYQAITQLHQECMPKPAAKVTVAAARKRVRVPVTDIESSDTEEDKTKEKTKAKRAKKDPNAPKAPKAPSTYSMFTAQITKMHKGDLAAADVKVKITLDKPTKEMTVWLENPKAQRLVNMKDNEMTIGELLTVCQKIVNDITGKIHAMKLSALMWCAIGNKNPF
jgi:hypothetical protein